MAEPECGRRRAGTIWPTRSVGCRVGRGVGCPSADDPVPHAATAHQVRGDRGLGGVPSGGRGPDPRGAREEAPPARERPRAPTRRDDGAHCAAGAAVRAAEGPRSRARSGGGTVAGTRPRGPVSYTHLTLPTSDLV